MNKETEFYSEESAKHLEKTNSTRTQPSQHCRDDNEKAMNSRLLEAISDLRSVKIERKYTKMPEDRKKGELIHSKGFYVLSYQYSLETDYQFQL